MIQRAGKKKGVEKLSLDEESRKVKPRPRSYARHMLGLHKDVWKGVKPDEYVRKEREAWARDSSSRA